MAHVSEAFLSIRDNCCLTYAGRPYKSVLFFQGGAKSTQEELITPGTQPQARERFGVKKTEKLVAKRRHSRAAERSGRSRLSIPAAKFSDQ